MFSTRNTQASSTTRNPDQDVATAPEIKTSTSVVNSLARSLVGASPGQVSIAAYLKFQYPAGKRPGAIEKHWLGLRKVATHMKTVELQAIQTGRKVRGEDRIMAARRSVNFLHTVIKSIGVEETNHPSFRKELIEHLENIVNWYPRAPFVWAMAYKGLLPGEFLTIKGGVYDKDACRLMMIHMKVQKARASATG